MFVRECKTVKEKEMVEDNKGRTLLFLSPMLHVATYPLWYSVPHNHFQKQKCIQMIALDCQRDLSKGEHAGVKSPSTFPQEHKLQLICSLNNTYPSPNYKPSPG